jgi:hypothetical protein
MNQVVPWAALVGRVALIELQVPSGKIDLPPLAVLTMLRTHFRQQWFGHLSPTQSSLEDPSHNLSVFALNSHQAHCTDLLNTFIPMLCLVRNAYDSSTFPIILVGKSCKSFGRRLRLRSLGRSRIPISLL